EVAQVRDRAAEAGQAQLEEGAQHLERVAAAAQSVRVGRGGGLRGVRRQRAFFCSGGGPALCGAGRPPASPQRCCPQRRTVTGSSAAKPRLSTASPISTTSASPANTRSV